MFGLMIFKSITAILNTVPVVYDLTWHHRFRYSPPARLRTGPFFSSSAVNNKAICDTLCPGSGL